MDDYYLLSIAYWLRHWTFPYNQLNTFRLLCFGLTKWNMNKFSLENYANYYHWITYLHMQQDVEATVDTFITNKVLLITSFCSANKLRCAAYGYQIIKITWYYNLIREGYIYHKHRIRTCRHRLNSGSLHYDFVTWMKSEEPASVKWWSYWASL